MHAGLHIPACILNQTFSPLGIPQRFRPVEIRSKAQKKAPPTGSAFSSIRMPQPRSGIRCCSGILVLLASHCEVTLQLLVNETF